jgi:hypothetical protein
MEKPNVVEVHPLEKRASDGKWAKGSVAKRPSAATTTHV